MAHPRYEQFTPQIKAALRAHGELEVTELLQHLSQPNNAAHGIQWDRARYLIRQNLPAAPRTISSRVLTELVLHDAGNAEASEAYFGNTRKVVQKYLVELESQGLAGRSKVEYVRRDTSAPGAKKRKIVIEYGWRRLSDEFPPEPVKRATKPISPFTLPSYLQAVLLDGVRNGEIKRRRVPSHRGAKYVYFLPDEGS